MAGDVCRPVSCLIAGVFFLLWGVWATHLWFRFTPIYQDMTCHPGKVQRLEGLKVGVPLLSPTVFTLPVETVCSNPNFYTISLVVGEPGEVFLGEDRVKVGQAMGAPERDSELPAHGNGSMWMQAKVHISASTMLAVSDLLFARTGVPLYMELNQMMRIDIGFFFGHWGVRKWVRKKCGMMLGSLSTTIRDSDPTGPLACANSWDELHVLPLTSTGSMFDMKIVGGHMDPEELAKGKLAKNIGLGVTMIVMYVLGVGLVLRAISLFIEAKKARKGRVKLATADHNNDACY